MAELALVAITAAGGGRHNPHHADIGLEGFAAFLCEIADSEGVFALKGFRDDDVGGFFEFGEVTGKIALGEAAFALEVEEVCFGDSVKHRHDHKARRFVNYTIQGRQCLQIGCHAYAWGVGLRKR
jgi:hypothetical protein